MSIIQSKPFDKAAKIFRTIFKGSPNLLTTSDVNRQFEALKYQIDAVEAQVGVVSDYVGTTSYGSGSITINPVFSYLEVRGCSFSPANTPLTLPLQEGGKVFVCLTANTEEVTYDTDFSHKVSGALFEDGTSAPAANQLRYIDETLLLAATPPQDCLAVLAAYTLNGGTIVEYNNCMPRGNSMAMGASLSIKTLDKTINVNSDISQGMKYDDAFSILQKRYKAENPFTQWTNCTLGGVDVDPGTSMFKCINNQLQIVVGKTTRTVVNTKGDSYVVYVQVNLPTALYDEIGTKLLAISTAFSNKEDCRICGAIPIPITHPTKKITGCLWATPHIIAPGFGNALVSLAITAPNIAIDGTVEVSKSGNTSFLLLEGCILAIPNVMFTIPL